MHLQTILFPEEDICSETTLYVRRTDENEISFNTYFNLFSLDKWKKYTMLSELYLSLELRGYKKLRIFNNFRELHCSELAEKEKKTYTTAIPIGDLDGALWFTLEEAGNCPRRHCTGWYCTEPDKAAPAIHLVLNICTYQREESVRTNLSHIKKYLLDTENEVSSHLDIFIVDNGCTLKREELGKGPIHLFYNKNLGGSGGFTRGLIEAQKRRREKGYTHVIFMDDDAVLVPDALVRTYALLRLLKPEYQDIAIGGAVLRTDYPFIQHAAGERWERGKLINPHQGLDLRDYESCIKNEIETAVNYAGWWYCCWPLQVANKKNLPLPLFIHLDDVEYGLRNQKNGFLYLNGISVWHNAFQNNKPSKYAYYELRNNLIIRMMSSCEGRRRDIIMVVLKRITGNVLSYRFQDIELNYMAVKDTLRGIDWLKHMDGEQLNKQVAKKGYKMRILEELTEDQGILSSADRQIKNQGIEDLYSKYIPAFDLKRRLTFNGWLLPAKRGKAVPFFLGTPLNRFYRVRQLLLFDPDTRQGMVVKKSFTELLKAYAVFLRALGLILKNYGRVSRQYRSRGKELKDIEFWTHYLDCSDESEVAEKKYHNTVGEK